MGFGGLWGPKVGPKQDIYVRGGQFWAILMVFIGVIRAKKIAYNLKIAIKGVSINQKGPKKAQFYRETD